MKEIILDGKEFIDIQTTYQILKKVFEFPDYYGKNMDALWDCLTDWYLEEKAHIVWKNFSISKTNLGEDADIMLEIFNRAQNQYGDFTIEIIP